MKKYTISNYAGVKIISTYTRREDGETVQVTYYSYDNDIRKFGCEVYSGQNYIVDSDKPSYSRNYRNFKGMPKKYTPIVAELLEKFVKIPWITWETASKNRIDIEL